MFFDLGWSEMLVIGAVALVVIGPKELPNALRTAGYWVRKARSLSREFQGSFEQMIREAELDEVRKDLKKATEFDIESEFRKTVDPTGELAESVKLPVGAGLLRRDRDQAGGRPRRAHRLRYPRPR